MDNITERAHRNVAALLFGASVGGKVRPAKENAALVQRQMQCAEWDCQGDAQQQQELVQISLGD